MLAWLPWIIAAVAVSLALFLLLRRGGPGTQPDTVPSQATKAEEVPATLRSYYERARAGDPSAMRMIGVMYYHGLDVPRNPEEGLKWYRKAAAAGSKTAEEELKSLEGRPR